MSTSPDEESIFAAALEYSDPGARAEYVEQACGDNSPLRRRVAMLLSAFGEGDFLEAGPTGVLATAAFGEVSERPGSSIGPYKLLEQIGEGGMGLVFMAEQTEPIRRRVALKIIKPGLDTHAVVARFEAERQALALMDHPNIARVIDAGATSTGRPYFVMELVRGIPITDYCRDHNLDLRERLELFINVCQAVQHAHQKGIIHRDLKPSNILVAHDDTRPVPKVIDFGVAKATTQQLTERTLFTHFAQLIGTPLYMSPEQAEFNYQDVDTRSDVYSLGVVLYELLTGTTPFEANRLRSAGPDEMRRIIREEDPPKPSTRATTMAAASSPVTTEAAPKGSGKGRVLGTSLKGDLDWIVMKCLEKDRRRRYESASALGGDVARYLADEAVEACPPSGRYRVGKFVRRHRGTFALGLAAMVLSVGVVATVVANSWRSAERRQLVRLGLAEARTAIEAADLTIAESRTAKSQGLLQALGVEEPSLEDEIESLQREIEARRAELHRFEEFVKLADDAQQRMWIEVSPTREGPALRALSMYEIRTDPDWLSKLEASYLDAVQKTRVKQEAYFLLISLANSRIQWNKGGEGLSFLNEAEVIGGESRASLLVRAKGLEELGEQEAATRSSEQARATPAISAWDHLFEAYHSTAKDGFEAAVTAYQAALRIQPDHYVALYGFADRLATEKGRAAEAVQLFTGCIALRPHRSAAYRARANAYVKLGNRAAADLDVSEAIRQADSEIEEAEARRQRVLLHNRFVGDEADREDLSQVVASLRRELEQATATLGAENDYTLTVRHLLANAQAELAPSEESLGYFLDTLQVVEKVHGADHEHTGLVHRDVARLYDAMGRYVEAIRHWKLALRIRDLVTDPHSSETIRYLDGLARATHMSGDVEGAIDLFEQALARWKQSHKANQGPAWLLNNAGHAYFDAGRVDEALPLFELALEQIVADRGLAHPMIRAVTNGLVKCYSQGERRMERLPLLLKAIEAQARVLGADHPEVLVWKNDLAFADFRRGRVTRAIAVQQDLLPRFVKVLGPEHVDTIQATLNLADMYFEDKRLNEARTLLEKSWEQWQRLDTKNATAMEREAYGRLLGRLGDLNDLTGRSKAATSYWRLFLKHSRESDPNEIELPLTKLINSLMRDEADFSQATPAELEPLLRELLALHDKAMPDDWRRFDTVSRLGAVLSAEQRFEEAEPLLLEGYHGMVEREARIPSKSRDRLAESIQRLVDLYQQTGRPEEAARWQEMLSTVAKPQ